MSQKGPAFVRYFQIIIDALKELGGSARPAEVVELISSKYDISDEDVNTLLKGGQSRFENQINWARFYLTQAGILDSSQRGVWTLTEKGRNTKLSHNEAVEIFRKIHKPFSDEWHKRKKEQKDIDVIDEDESDVEIAEDGEHRSQLLELLKSLPPSGFERICQRLLRESGFQNVVVTGRSGDGGIDGHGVLQINPLVSVQVLFQCKRYQGAVTPSQVRDFRGAMSGRTEKGIIMTTGTFSGEARKEAIRDGVPPIELVDGDRLVEMFEQLELGLKPRTVYDIDESFFSEYREE